jgi:hypothetical protein
MQSLPRDLPFSDFERRVEQSPDQAGERTPLSVDAFRHE